MRSLIQKGFIEPVGDRFRVKDFDKWVYRKKTAGMQYRDAEKQMENADKQDISAEMQDIPF
jgi:hypothetical protein